MPTKRATRVIEGWDVDDAAWRLESAAGACVSAIERDVIFETKRKIRVDHPGREYIRRRITIIVEDLPAKAKKGASK